MHVSTKVCRFMRKNYNLAVGEMTAEATALLAAKIGRRKIRVRGRSIETGRRKTVHVAAGDLLSLRI